MLDPKVLLLFATGALLLLNGFIASRAESAKKPESGEVAEANVDDAPPPPEV